MSQPTGGKLSDSGHAQLPERGRAMRHAGLPAMPESRRELSPAERRGALYSGVPDLPNPPNGHVSAERSRSVPDAGDAAVS